MGTRRRRIPLGAATMVLVLVLSSSGNPGGAYHMENELPVPVAMTCAVFTGIVVYVFGGATDDALLDTIYAVNPGNGRTSVLSYKLPSPRKLASAVWTGTEAYIIGGIGYDAEPIAEIVRFVPDEGVSVVEGAMPYGTKGVPAVWDGEAVCVLGNCLSAEQGQYDVIRYYPGNGTTQVLEDELPIPGAGSSAAWAGDRAYIVGGRQNLTVLSDRIIEYVPGEGATLVDGRLPKGRMGTASAWDGEALYTFGGTVALECGPLECVPIDYLDEVTEYDPVNDTCTLSGHTLPVPMDLRAAVFTGSGYGSKVLIPGGLTSEGPVNWLLVYYTNPPEIPRDQRSITEIILRWAEDHQTWILTAMVLIAVAAVLVLLLFYRGRNGRVAIDEATEI
jgi:hypothetical protein